MAVSPIGSGSELPFLASGGQMGELTASKDWSGTVLGSPAHWPAALRGAVGIMLSSRFPMFVGWGPQLIMLYNDAYAPILGKKHPDAMGQPFERVWHELWTVIEPLTTARVMGERRLRTLRELGDTSAAQAPTVRTRVVGCGGDAGRQPC